MFGLLACALAVLVGRAWWVAPDGVSGKNAQLQSVFIDEARYRKLSWSGLVSERSRRALWTWPGTVFASEEKRAEATARRDAELALYDSLASDPEFVAVGSADAVGGDGHHLFVYLPTAVQRNPVALLVVLQGPVGNRLAPVWVLKGLAEEHGIALVVPTSPKGDWDPEDAAEILDATTLWVGDRPGLFRRDKRLLVGAGGSGEHVALAARRGGYKGVIYLGVDVPEGADLEVPGLPLVIIHGQRDSRLTSVGAVEAGAGIEARVDVVPGGDERLLVSAPDETLEALERAMQELM